MNGRQPSSPAVRLSRALWMVLPIAVGLVAILIGMTPLPSGSLPLTPPALGLMTLYYFTLARPDMVSPLSPFVLGIVQDLLIGTPLGLSALVFLVAYGFAQSQRLFFIAQPAQGPWFGFVLTMAIAAATGFLAASVYQGAAVLPWPFAIQAILSIALYPVFDRVLGILNARLPANA